MKTTPNPGFLNRTGVSQQNPINHRQERWFHAVWAVMLAAFGAWSLTASLAAAEVFEVSLPAEFSGIMEVQTTGESRPMSMPIYISKNRTRVDMVSPTMPDMAGSGLQRGARSPMEDLFPMVTIFLPDQGKQIIMLPAKKVAAQEDILPAALKILQEGQNTRVKVDSSNYEGEATVDGHPCKKYRVQPVGTNAEASIQYLATDLGQFPIRTETAKSVTTFKAIKIGPVDEALFKIPADYRLEVSTTKMFLDSIKMPGVGRDIVLPLVKGIVAGAIGGAIGGYITMPR